MRDEDISVGVCRYSTLELPKNRYIPGKTKRPQRSPVNTLTTVLESGFQKSEAFCYGVDLYNNGFYWEAHEAWEHLWIPRKESAAGIFLKGLIQLTASMVKRVQGNTKGEELLRTGALELLNKSGLVSQVLENEFNSLASIHEQVLSLKTIQSQE